MSVLYDQFNNEINSCRYIKIEIYAMLKLNNTDRLEEKIGEIISIMLR